MVPRKITKLGSIIPLRFNSFLKRFSGLTLVSLYGPMHFPDGHKLSLCDLPTEYGLLYLVGLLFRYLNLWFILAPHFQTRPQTHLMVHAILASTLQNSKGQGEIVLGLPTDTAVTVWVMRVERGYQEVQSATL